MKGILVGLVFILGCGTSEDRTTDLRRFAKQSAGYSTVEPGDSWTRTTDHDAVMFVGRGDRQKHSIVIRAAAKPSSLGENTPSTPSNVAIATERVLAAMPGAHIAKKWLVEKTALPTTEFTMTFTPGRASRHAYQRRHAVIIGEKHIFHVFYTAPAGEDIDQTTFDAMVAAIREEV